MIQQIFTATIITLGVMMIAPSQASAHDMHAHNNNVCVHSVHNAQQAISPVSHERGVRIFRFGPTQAQQQNRLSNAQNSRAEAQLRPANTARAAADNTAIIDAYERGLKKGFDQASVNSRTQPRRRLGRYNYGRRYTTYYSGYGPYYRPAYHRRTRKVHH